MDMKKEGGHLMVTTRKTVQHRVVNIREAVGKLEVEEIISPSVVPNMLHPSSYVDFTNEVERQ